MITHATPDGWQIIYQRAHALLSGQIALHWRNDQRPKRWMETLAAITQHDDGGLEWEGKDLLTPVGAPRDFTMGSAGTGKPQQAVTHARYQGRYVALLQSMHVTALYSGSDDPEMREFLKGQQAYQTRWRKELGLSKAEAETCYRLVYLCDAFSLVLCQRQLPTDGRQIEVGQGPDGTPYFARRLPQTDSSDPNAETGEVVDLTLEPWPFEPDAFEMGIEATTIKGLTFKTDQALVDAMQNGDISVLTWRLKKVKTS
jgi:hypothetical protein